MYSECQPPHSLIQCNNNIYIFSFSKYMHVVNGYLPSHISIEITSTIYLGLWYISRISNLFVEKNVLPLYAMSSRASRYEKSTTLAILSVSFITYIQKRIRTIKPNCATFFLTFLFPIVLSFVTSYMMVAPTKREKKNSCVCLNLL
jgi:hypothetical protein